MEDSLMHCTRLKNHKSTRQTLKSSESSPTLKSSLSGPKKSTETPGPKKSSLFPLEPHSAMIAGQTGCGKTVFILDLLEQQYHHVFQNIVILCPTVPHNQSYKRSWIWSDPQVYIIDPGTLLHDCLRMFYKKNSRNSHSLYY